MSPHFSSLGAPPVRRRGRPPKSGVGILADRVRWTAAVLAAGSNGEVVRYSRELRPIGLELRRIQARISDYELGLRGMSATWWQRLVHRFPSLKMVARYPFGLLELSPPTSRYLQGLQRLYVTKGEYLDRYRAPRVRSSDSAVHLFLSQSARGKCHYNQQELCWRGDAFGFFALLAIYRMHAKSGEVEQQMITAFHLVNALPGLCREPVMYPHRLCIISSVGKLLSATLPFGVVPFGVDVSVLLQQIEATSFSPNPYHRFTLDSAFVEAASWIPERARNWYSFQSEEIDVTPAGDAGNGNGA